jgi:ABC-type spermidine/putrescine transport system permease subunit II
MTSLESFIKSFIALLSAFILLPLIFYFNISIQKGQGALWSIHYAAHYAAPKCRAKMPLMRFG